MQTERRLRLPEPPHGWLRYYGHLLQVLITHMED